jgi:hypothetical protein
MPSLTPLRAAARTSTAVATRQPDLKFPLSFRRTFSQTKSAQSGHGPSYDPPSGWLFGVKPGEKYQKEGWEGVWYWGFYGSFALATIAYAFKPDTRYVERPRRLHQQNKQLLPLGCVAKRHGG